MLIISRDKIVSFGIERKYQKKLGEYAKKKGIPVSEALRDLIVKVLEKEMRTDEFSDNTYDKVLDLIRFLSIFMRCVISLWMPVLDSTCK